MKRERVLRYGSREWLRRLPKSTPAVGAKDGLVVVRVDSFSGGPTRFAKVVGGTAEAPTVIGMRPEELPGVIWATGPHYASGASAAWDSRLGSDLSVGAADKRDEGAGATPWIFGGLLIAAAFGVAAMEKKMGAAR